MANVMNGQHRRSLDKRRAVHTPGQSAQRRGRGKRPRNAENRTGHEPEGCDQSQSRVAKFRFLALHFLVLTSYFLLSPIGFCGPPRGPINLSDGTEVICEMTNAANDAPQIVRRDLAR